MFALAKSNEYCFSCTSKCMSIVQFLTNKCKYLGLILNKILLLLFCWYYYKLLDNICFISSTNNPSKMKNIFRNCFIGNTNAIQHDTGIYSFSNLSGCYQGLHTFLKIMVIVQKLSTPNGVAAIYKLTS